MLISRSELHLQAVAIMRPACSYGYGSCSWDVGLQPSGTDHGESLLQAQPKQGVMLAATCIQYMHVYICACSGGPIAISLRGVHCSEYSGRNLCTWMSGMSSLRLLHSKCFVVPSQHASVTAGILCRLPVTDDVNSFVPWPSIVRMLQMHGRSLWPMHTYTCPTSSGRCMSEVRAHPQIHRPGPPRHRPLPLQPKSGRKWALRRHFG